MGCDLTAQLHNAQILDDEGINIVLGRMADQLAQLLGLPVGHQGVQGQMHRNATDVAILDGIHQGLGGKILRALSCIKGAYAQVDCIGTVLPEVAAKLGVNAAQV